MNSEQSAESTSAFHAVRIRTRSPFKEARDFKQLLADHEYVVVDRSRLLACLGHEQHARAAYHHRPYLRHLSSRQLHQRVAQILANAVFVSSRGRYAVNGIDLSFWRERLAHTAEELACRGETNWIGTGDLLQLPELGFPTPSGEFATRGSALYRYDKLRHLRSLRSNGSILLRCASTESPHDNPARADGNELCVELDLQASDLEIVGAESVVDELVGKKSIQLSMLQSDFYMFCVSATFDWRLFSDFDSNEIGQDPEDEIACLVINDPSRFRNLMLRAASKFREPRPLPRALGLRFLDGRAFYYDPFDATHCAPLFGAQNRQPFAKRFEFAYQREYRFVFQPVLPENEIPDTASASPRLERAVIEIGSLEDFSTIVRPSLMRSPGKRFYLCRKDARMLAAAIGVSASRPEDSVRFIYSVEKRELSRSDSQNPVRRLAPKLIRFNFTARRLT